ncbi:MAG: hypothetical protein BRD48_03995 [Bacteroidetes bacterium QS_9_68_14]|nr:MAG: hypothetical protein BRD48_03995 [Bacteroidetes bacterium QS_9_68_14]
MSEETTRLVERLRRRLRHAVRRLTLGELAFGAVVTFGALAALWLASVAVEASLWMRPGLRTVVVSVVGVAALALLGTFVARPLGRLLGLLGRPSDQEAARRVGARFPERVADRFVNVLQLASGARSGEAEDAGQPLADRAVARLGRAVENVEFEEEVENFSRARRASRWAAAPIAGLLVFILAAPGAFFGASGRLLAPTDHFQRPAPFQLSLTAASGDLVKGDSLMVTARARPVAEGNALPPRVTLQVQTRGDDGFQAPGRDLTLAPTDSSRTRFRHVFTGVRQDVRYRAVARANGRPVRTGWRTVTVRERPRVAELRVTLDPPAYSGLPERALATGTGDVTALPGTEVNVEATLAGPATQEALLRFASGDVDTLAVEGGVAAGAFTLEDDGAYRVALRGENGVPSDAPIRYRLQTTSDAAPTVSFEAPAPQAELTDALRPRLQWQMSDDFGFAQQKLYYRLAERREGEPASEFQSVEVPIGRPGLLDQQVTYDWVLEQTTDLDLAAGDVLEYYVRVWDNNRVAGYQSARTQVQRLRLPSTSEKYQQLEKTQEGAQEQMQRLRQQSEETRRQFESLREEVRRTRGGDWNTQRQVERMQQRRQQMQKQVQKLQRQIEKATRQMQQGELTSPETQRQYEQLQRVAEQIQSPKLKEALQKLQKAMQEMDMEQMQQAMQNVERKRKQYRQRLERARELFEKIKAQQEMEEVARRAGELAEEERRLSEETRDLEEERARKKEGKRKVQEGRKEASSGEKSSGEKGGGQRAQDRQREGQRREGQRQGRQQSGQKQERGQQPPSGQKRAGQKNAGQKKQAGRSAEQREQLARDQEEARKQMQKLRKQMRKLSKNMRDMRGAPKQEMQKMQQRAKQVPQKMKKNSRQLRKGQLDKARQGQKQMQQRLQQMQQSVSQMKKGMQRKRKRVNMAGLRQALARTLRLSKEQEALRGRSSGLSPGSPALREVTRRQDQLAEGLRATRDSLTALAKKIPKMTRAVQEKSRAALKAMEQATEAMTGRTTQPAGGHQRTAMKNLNELALLLSRLTEQMRKKQGGKGGGMSAKQMRQKLQQMAGQQKKLGGQVQQMLNQQQGERLSQGQRQRLGQMAKQQKALQKQLEKLREQGGDGRTIGRLEKVAEQMEEMVRRMQRGQLDRKTIERQQQIRSRLLQARQSLQKQGRKDQRRSQEATDGDRTRAQPASEAPEGEAQRLRRSLIRSLESGYTPDYEQLIKRYFELLQKQKQEQKEAAPSNAPQP